MADIDSSAEGLSAGIVRQVFDGAGDDEAFGKMLVTRLGLACPFKIRAIQHRHLEAPAAPRNCLAFPVHNRLVAWVGTKPPRPPMPFVSGESVVVENPRQLIASLRQAIISMRRFELEGLSREGKAYMSPDEEKELVQLTVQALRHAPEKALPLAATCCQALVFRHSRILNSLRAKLLELLSSATAPIGVESVLSHRYMETVQRVLSTYALSEFVEWFPGQLVQVATLAEKARRESAHSHSPLISEAIHYLDHRFTSPISLEETAGALHVSKEHLARRFKQETGMTVLAKLNDLRIEAAKEQLTQSRAPLKVIADACGFGTMENFQRLFKKVVGLAPGRYRREQVAGSTLYGAV